MTPHEFIAKWQQANLSERSACQQHFLDLCDLLGQPKPAAADPEGAWYTFEKGVQKTGGGDGWADVWMRGHFGWEYKGKRKNLDEAYKQLLLYREALENPPLLVVCDLDRFEVHTNFTGTAKRKYEFPLADLAQPRNFDVLRKLFEAPDALRPDVTSEKITADAARRFADLAERLRMRVGEEKGTGPIGAQHPQGRSGQSDLSPFSDPGQRIAHFLMKLMFCMFGEDIGLLPKKLFGSLLEKSKQNPASLTRRLETLFAAMAKGGDFGSDEILWFNGGLFCDADVIPLAAEEINILAAVNDYDWAAVEPSIFGTLFESVLDPGKRSQIGAHYTGRADIETLVQPVVMAPLRREWEEVRRQCEEKLWPAVVKGSRSQTGKRAAAKPSAARVKFDRAIQDFLERLAHVTVFDPACGSGNFLYVSLHLLLDLEKEVITYAASRGLSLVPHVHPRQLSGLEINPYAQQLASVVLWIGYLQWMHHNGFKMPSHPVLEPIETIRCQDAILDLTDPAHPKEPEWPEAEFIVGNPPFLGDKLMRGGLGDEYVNDLRAFYEGRVPGGVDLCCYWFEKARTQIEAGKCKRAGLLATQGIRGGVNRTVLQRIKETGEIFFAISDRDWILDGANVHISMVAFDDGTQKERTLDGHSASTINANLSGASDTTQARRLSENADTAFIGTTKKAPLDISEQLAIEFLNAGGNPHGLPNSDVVFPYINGNTLTRRSSDEWIIDFGERSLDKACLYELPFAYVKKVVYPQRVSHREPRQRDKWWLLARSCPEMQAAIASMPRFLATPTVCKHRVFAWFSSPIEPDHQLYVFARDDDYFFGVLQSRVHEVWALRQGTRLETRPRYTPTTCFETFPFPFALGGAADGVGLHPTEGDAVGLRPTEDVTRRTESHSVQADKCRMESHSVPVDERRMESHSVPGDEPNATDAVGLRPTTQDAVGLRPTGEDAACAAIAAAARELDDLRCRWLNPPEWTKTEVLEFPGSLDGPWARYIDPATIARRMESHSVQSAQRRMESHSVPSNVRDEEDAVGLRPTPDAVGLRPTADAVGLRPTGEMAIGTVRWPRIVPKDADCAASLKKRTLTTLYNERPAWLDLAHKRLDAAVFAAYGWDPGISDETLLEKLLALNLERAKEAQT